MMSSEEKFRIETFYAILDRIVTDLNNRIRAYSETDTRFLFLRHHELQNFDAVKDSLSRLTSFYFDAEILMNGCSGQNLRRLCIQKMHREGRHMKCCPL